MFIFTKGLPAALCTLLLLLSFADPIHALTRKQKCWGCSVPANTTLVPSIADIIQVGSASFIRGDLAERWSSFTGRNGQRYRGFRYCFEDAQTKEALTCNGGQFYGAQAMWTLALGRPGEASGHSFVWQEANNGETDRAKYETYFCYNEVVLEGLPRAWNDRVPDDTLIISDVADSTQSRATVGYRGVNKGRRPHELIIGLKAPAVVIAHEMGHVMGMVHEHNRNDRDDYVRFNCHNIEGSYDALGRAMSMGNPVIEARRRLCEDRDFAAQSAFNSPAFLKNEILSGDPGKWGALDEPGGYDIDSIMHYSSFAFIDNIDACGESHDHCTLLRIEKDGQGNEVDTRLIDRPKKPSIGDVVWVKKNYCWPADADCT